jgi:Protein of unknown function (DUF2911)
MKKLFTLTLLALFAATTMFAQGMGNEKKRVSPHETISGNNVKVTYGRPYKKGRDIFGGLVPYDQVWRTGADEATEITFEKDGMFGDKPIKAGTYTLFTIPGKSEWTVILNSQLKQWGAFGYDKVKDKDVLTTKTKVMTLDKPAEEFTIQLINGGMIMQWDKTQVIVPIKF